jgi:hypothetical protein
MGQRFRWLYLHVGHERYIPVEQSEEFGDLTLIELNVIYDNVTGRFQATQHSVVCEVLHAAFGLEALYCFSGRVNSLR